MPIFGSFDIGISWVPATGPGGTNKISHAVGGKCIIIVIKIPFIGRSSTDLAVFDFTYAAISHLSLRDTTFPYAQGARYPFWCLGGLFRQSVSISAVMMKLLDFGPNVIEIGLDTISTKADHL
jgi:hypothetical protein